MSNIKNWSLIPASNNAAPPQGAPEGMAPSTVNDIIRQQMADHRAQWEDGQWFDYGFSISYTSATVLRFNQTSQAALTHANRRVKAGVGAGAIYGSIQSTSVTSSDTVFTVTWDSGSADASLSYVELGITTFTNSALPRIANLNKAIYGFTYANNVADAVNDIDVAAGGAMDATGAYWITGAALTKRLDAAWAVGNNQGGLDTGAVGNSDYYLWAIVRSDTAVVDYLFSLSSTAPTMPANYDYKRLIGWLKRVGGTIVAFHAYETEGGGLELSWDVPTTDVSLTNTLGQTRRTDAVKVPLNFSVIAILSIQAFDAASSFSAWCTCPDHTDGTTTPPTRANIGINSTSVAGIGAIVELRIRTSAAGLVASRCSITTIDEYDISTQGFTWARRN